MHDVKKVNFLCVGTQKAGTTTLHDILSQHPEIYLPENKEAHFFDINKRYTKGLHWWLDTFFSNYSNEKIMGVMTPEYLYYPEVASRIKKDLGEPKIVIVLRDPVERAFSHYLMSKRRGLENLSFDKAMLYEKERIGTELGRNHFSYIDRGLYYSQVKRYFELFKPKDIKVFLFEEDIKVNLEQTMAEIQDFLGVSYVDLDTNKRSNVASTPKSQLVNKLLYGTSYLKSVVRKVIPSQNLRSKLYQIADGLNQKTAEKQVLSDKEKSLVFKKYFERDVRLLEDLLGKKIHKWNRK